MRLLEEFRLGYIAINSTTLKVPDGANSKVDGWRFGLNDFLTERGFFLFRIFCLFSSHYYFQMKTSFLVSLFFSLKNNLAIIKIKEQKTKNKKKQLLQKCKKKIEGHRVTRPSDADSGPSGMCRHTHRKNQWISTHQICGFSSSSSSFRFIPFEPALCFSDLFRVLYNLLQ